MNRTLRGALIGLVMANLCFAYITEAARWIWLGPFMALTLASPWLARWADRLWYRGVWNLAVLAGFASLVHHITTAGAAHLLEDGLLLATLAQVHLLNNIGRLQKPDIIFFNSFLIAIVTSFLSVDVGYSVVFLAYAPLLILGMQLLAAPDHGLKGAAARTGVVLGCTLLAFFLVPRDFQRKGFFAESMQLRDAARLAEVDFAREVSLDQAGAVIASNRVVLRVHLKSGERHDVPQHWRGATLDLFDGRKWRAASEGRVRVRNPWRRARTPGLWVRGRGAVRARVEVERVADTDGRMPVPLASRTIHLLDSEDRMTVRAARDLTFRAIGTVPSRYGLGVAPVAVSGGKADRLQGGDASTHVMLPSGSVPESAKRLAAELRRQSPDLSGYVERVAHHLRTQHVYLPPGAKGGARSLAEFLSGAAGGHCEYFASAMVVLLRLQFVPCRLVSGYRSDEWEPDRDVLLVRARHAHAWVEVFDAKLGWRTVDPTPADDSPDAVARLGFWTRFRYWVSGIWETVTGFNSGAYATLRRWAGNLALPALAGLIGVLLLIRLRGRRSEHGSARLYGRTLKRLGLRLAPGETPRELLGRAELEDAHRSLLEDATRRHELARYAVSPMSVQPGLASNS
ncbi:MAG: transglutaminase TgpA family protein [Planctomycetota bacterium]|jgi:transglutaminase-like putative cysteine protease